MAMLDAITIIGTRASRRVQAILRWGMEDGRLFRADTNRNFRMRTPIPIGVIGETVGAPNDQHHSMDSNVRIVLIHGLTANMTGMRRVRTDTNRRSWSGSPIPNRILNANETERNHHWNSDD
jgi:hypothetical protein